MIEKAKVLPSKDITIAIKKARLIQGYITSREEVQCDADHTYYMTEFVRFLEEWCDDISHYNHLRQERSIFKSYRHVRRHSCPKCRALLKTGEGNEKD